jgi:dTDP-4-amino-4,6-dideoxygalactose transaminase
VEEVTLCGSGTQALQLALQVACTSRRATNDLVALPAFTCYDVASAAIGAGVRVVFYDIDPDTLVADLRSVARVLERGPAAVVIAPLFGYQPDWDELRELTDRAAVTLIEDAAQSFGARWRDRPAGALGDLSVLSFGRGKGWTAVEGGALLGPASEVGAGSSALAPAKPFGGGPILFKGLAQWLLGRPALYGLPSVMPGLELGETVYHPPRTPHRISRLAARLALETEHASEAEADARRTRASGLTDRLNEALVPGSARCGIPRPHPESVPGALRLPVLVSPRARAELLARGRRLGLMPGYPQPLSGLEALQPFIAAREPMPGAEALAAALVTVPTHSLLTEADLRHIAAVFRDPHAFAS